MARSPEQERPKVRGSGTTVENATAALWDRTDVTDPGDPSAEGVPLATKPSDVKDRVERILGFRSVQFRQVVMLPQGKFQELLRSAGKEREEILQRLFRTERFRELQDALKAEAADAERERRDATAERDAPAALAGRSPRPTSSPTASRRSRPGRRRPRRRRRRPPPPNRPPPPR